MYNQIGLSCGQEKMPTTDLIMYMADLQHRPGPVKLALLEHGRYAAHPLAGVKVTSWLDNVWAAEKAHNRGFEDMVLLNEHGHVAECTAANIFFVHAGKVSTPPESSGCLAGVSRQILLEIASTTSLSIEQCDVTVEEMWAADEVFISSTTREAQPVSPRFILSLRFLSAPLRDIIKFHNLVFCYFSVRLKHLSSSVVPMSLNGAVRV